MQAQRRGELQRNFQGYSTHARTDLIGLGMSAIGKVGDCYVQNERHSFGYEEPCSQTAGCPSCAGSSWTTTIDCART